MSKRNRIIGVVAVVVCVIAYWIYTSDTPNNAVSTNGVSDASTQEVGSYVMPQSDTMQNETSATVVQPAADSYTTKAYSNQSMETSLSDIDAQMKGLDADISNSAPSSDESQ